MEYFSIVQLNNGPEGVNTPTSHNSMFQFAPFSDADRIHLSLCLLDFEGLQLQVRCIHVCKHVHLIIESSQKQQFVFW